MKWLKAGRPCTKTDNKQENKSENDWTKEELSILAATKHDSYIMLAIAVVKQWIKDGKPKSDNEGIKYWLSIISNALYDKSKPNTHDIGENND